MKIYLPLLLALATSLLAVPSDINYQGRLSDANGDAVTGDVSMSVKMYDAQSGGNEIYSEDIGTVTLDENGVYSFQFGASGNSTVTKTETIVTSDGTSTEYTGTFTSTPIDGTISVTDETYSWNDVDGNPGEQATAYIIIINGFVIYADVENGGSGYDDDNPPIVTITGDGTGATATATVENGVVTGIALPNAGNNYTEGEIIIAPPPAPFTVDKVDGNLEVRYASSPSNGTGVVATYKTLEPSIIGALSEASSHWLELKVDGTPQNPRERILSVPFAQVAGALSRSSENQNSSYKQLIVFGERDYQWDNTPALTSENSISIGANEAFELTSFVNSTYYRLEIISGNPNLVTDYYNDNRYEYSQNLSLNIGQKIAGPCVIYLRQTQNQHNRTPGIVSYQVHRGSSENQNSSYKQLIVFGERDYQWDNTPALTSENSISIGANEAFELTSFVNSTYYRLEIISGNPNLVTDYYNDNRYEYSQNLSLNIGQKIAGPCVIYLRQTQNQHNRTPGIVSYQVHR